MNKRTSQTRDDEEDGEEEEESDYDNEDYDSYEHYGRAMAQQAQRNPSPLAAVVLPPTSVWGPATNNHNNSPVHKEEMEADVTSSHREDSIRLAGTLGRFAQEMDDDGILDPTKVARVV